jgi:hypothetical protein
LSGNRKVFKKRVGAFCITAVPDPAGTLAGQFFSQSPSTKRLDFPIFMHVHRMISMI